MSWCEECGTVSSVCDDRQCDWHRRPEEVEQELAVLRQEMRRAAGRMWEIGLQIRKLPAGNTSPSLRADMRAESSGFRRMESEEAELEEELRRSTEAGPALVPRLGREEGGGPEPDSRQLRLF